MDDTDLKTAEDLADDMIGEITDKDGKPIGGSTVALYAALNVVAWVLHQANTAEKPDLCTEAQADLDEIVKTTLTPDSVFEAQTRRNRLKIVGNDNKAPS